MLRFCWGPSRCEPLPPADIRPARRTPSFSSCSLCTPKFVGRNRILVYCQTRGSAGVIATLQLESADGEIRRPEHLDSLKVCATSLCSLSMRRRPPPLSRTDFFAAIVLRCARRAPPHLLTRAFTPQVELGPATQTQVVSSIMCERNEPVSLRSCAHLCPPWAQTTTCKLPPDTNHLFRGHAYFPPKGRLL